MSAAFPGPMRRSAVRFYLGAFLIFVFALVVRWPRAGQSLWCDEMSTFLDYVTAPWQKVMAAGAGEYVPNDHVLFTILDKLVYAFAGTGEMGGQAVGQLAGHAAISMPGERVIRLPSLLAGACLPLALAWPYRIKAPAFAMLVALLACVHPWLVVFSTEARGYSLMLLLGVLATNCLPKESGRRPVIYGVLVAAMLYTVPVGLLLVAAHGIAVLMVRRPAFLSWLGGLFIAAAITCLLYLPMHEGLLAYYRHPLPAPDDYVDFVNQLPRFALLGQYLPHPADLLVDRSDPWVGWIWWILPIAILIMGSVIMWKHGELRLRLLALALPMPIAFVLAAVSHSTGQVRFVPWAAVWMCVAIAAILRRVGGVAMVVLTIAICGQLVWWDITMPPSQPIRDAFALIDPVIPPRQPVMVALLTAPQAAALYGPLVTQHQLVVAATIPAFLQAEQRVIAITGHRPGLVMSYEYLVRELQPDFWKYIEHHYRLIERLPGRLSPVSIYGPVD